MHTIFELLSSIKYKLTGAYIGDSNQSAHPHSLISLSILPEETLCPWLPKEHLLNTVPPCCFLNFVKFMGNFCKVFAAYKQV